MNLELSKVLMYKFHYDYIKNEYGTLLYLIGWAVGRVEQNAPGRKLSRLLKIGGLFLGHFLITIK